MSLELCFWISAETATIQANVTIGITYRNSTVSSHEFPNYICHLSKLILSFYKRYKLLAPEKLITLTAEFSSRKRKMSTEQSAPVLDKNHLSQQNEMKCRPLRQEVLHKETWLSLERAHYQTPNGERCWEMVRRVQRSSPVADGVTVIATLKRLFHYDCIILIKQYRPPLAKYTIEFPAGLIDAGESAPDAAIRELKEETGYLGTVQKSSPGVALDAGTSSCTVSMVHVDIDGDSSENSSPVQNLDEDEFIEVLIVPLHNLERQLKDWGNDNNIVIDAKVYVYSSCQPSKQPSLNKVENLSRKLGD
ncbi:ADP-sugar pyrophosphatase-like [Apostichopus japonicus]|uniref:ADP-sugar pyrophosphatase-like n=1 Tax=Stichopus japonicus TaxID=307972 RepID=UPI003AB82EBC